MYDPHRPLHVAYFCDAWPATVYPSGIHTYVANLRSGLSQLPVESRVLAGTIAPAYAEEGAFDINEATGGDALLPRLFEGIYARFSPFGAGLRTRARCILETLQKMEREWPVDLLEIEETFGLAHRLVGGLRPPTIVRLHGPWFVNGPALGVTQDRRFHRRNDREREAIESADAVSSPSRDVLNRVRDRFDLPLPDAEVIPNPGPEVSRDAVWKLQDSETDTILFVGRFDRHKGGDIMLDAFFRVLHTHPDARLIFVGPDSGLVDDRGKTWHLQEYLHHRFPDPKARRQVTVSGRLQHAEIEALRRRAFLTVVPSRYENFPLTVLEALAHGSPLICAGAGGMRELVEPGENGLQFESENTEDLSQKIEALLRNPDLASRLALQARRSYERKYAPAPVAQQMYEFYQRVAERHRGRNAPSP